MPISYIDMRIHAMIERGFCDETQKSVANMSNNHKEVWLEPRANAP